MKKIFFLLFFLLFLSCKKDELTPVNTNEEVKDFVWKGLNAFYLWKDHISELDEYQYNNQKALNQLLDEYSSPTELFESLLYQRNVIDRWSWIVNDYEALEKMFQGVRKTTGMRIGLVYEPGSNSQIFAYIKYVIPHSPADQAGLKRGDLFRKINNTYLNDQNYQRLLTNENLEIELAQWQGNQLMDTGIKILLNKVSLNENPIYLSKILSQNGKKIAYLMYNNFIPEYDKELNDVINDFKEEKIDELVLDLRYNSGGSVTSMQILASMITGQYSNKKLLLYQWHSQLQKWYEEKYPDRLFRSFIDKMEDKTPIQHLFLPKIYIIATKSSASASESLINCLKPYIEVTHIGTATHGKYTASITLYDSPDFNKTGANPNHKWAMQPIVLKISNVEGVSDFYEGLSPDIYQPEDYKNLGILGNPSEPLLHAAINKIMGLAPVYAKNQRNFQELFYRQNAMDGMQYIR